MSASDNLNRRQFLKADPNQMAFPGLEEISPNPGAPALAKGYRFEHESRSVDRGRANVHELRAVTQEGDIASQMWYTEAPWHAPWHEYGINFARGEIVNIRTRTYHEGEGLATALYGIGRTMARVKPQHSVERTSEGDAWAKSTVKKYGGRVPKNLLGDSSSTGHRLT